MSDEAAIPRAGPNDLAARYEMAARAAPGKKAARTAELSVDGYWLSPNLFSFVTDQTLPGSSDGFVAPMPFVVDALGGARRSLASFDQIQEWVKQAALFDARPDELQYDQPSPGRLAIGCQGAWILIDLDSGQVVEKRSAPAAPEIYSPGRTFGCFLDGYDLWLRELQSGRSRQLTAGGEPLNAIGRQQENSLGPVSYRRRPVPVVAWSADERWLLTHQIDERACADFTIVQHVAAGPRPAAHTFKMTMPGETPPTIRLVAIEVETGRQVSSDSFDFSMFSPVETGGAWFSGDAFLYVAYDRHARHVALRRVDLRTGRDEALLSETAEFEGYLELGQLGGPPNVRVMAGADEIVWRSARDGHTHFYLHRAGEEQPLRQLTQGPWEARDIVFLDEEARQLYFTASGFDDAPNLTARRFLRVSLDGGEPETLLRWEGDIAIRREQPDRYGVDRPFRPREARVSVSPSGAHVVARYTTLPDVKTCIAPLGSVRPSLILARARRAARQPTAIAFPALAADGKTPLEGVIFLPSDFDPARKYPVLDFIYPGPQSTLVPQAYASRFTLQAQTWAQLGLAVLMLDSTGIPFRERTVRQAGYGDLLEPQLADHVAVVRQLCEQHDFLDASRVGMVGASGGGAATAQALFRYPEVYRAGVAICGNYDSRAYRSGWMDLYVGPEGQTDSRHAIQTFADGLRGALMLVSGDMDDNVPLSQTLLVADALIKANKDFDLIVLPNEGHMVLLTSTYLQRRIWDFFSQHLLGAEPPRQFSLNYSPEEAASLGRASQRDGAWG